MLQTLDGSPAVPVRELLEAATAELAALETEAERRRYRADPVSWAEERIGAFLWSKQQEVLRALAVHRKVAVMSCHEVGKSFIAGVAGGWWIDSSLAGEAFLVTSAPSGPQVKAILWRELARVHTAGNLAGRVNQVEWYLPVGGKEELVAFGRKPDEYDPTAFQGIHARRVLVIFDEACGIHGLLWEAADSLVANDNSKMLLIGNPDMAGTEFHEACKPGSGWHVIQIGAFASPNFTGEPVPTWLAEQLVGRLYVEEKRKKQARDWVWVDAAGAPSDAQHGVRVVPPAQLKPEDINPYWAAKVLGQFPESGQAGGLIPATWVRAAQERNLEPGTPVKLGVDVGGGGDTSCVCHRRGSVYRIKREDHNPDTMETCGNVIADLIETGAEVAQVDMIGIGWGLVNRGKELRHPFVGVNVSKSALVDENSEEAEATDERFMNLKAQLCWHVRELFEAGLIDLDPDDEELAAQLLGIRWKRNSKGKIQILDKRRDDQGRKIASPNRAEALVLASADNLEEAGGLGGALVF